MKIHPLVTFLGGAITAVVLLEIKSHLDSKGEQGSRLTETTEASTEPVAVQAKDNAPAEKPAPAVDKAVESTDGVNIKLVPHWKLNRVNYQMTAGGYSVKGIKNLNKAKPVVKQVSDYTFKISGIDKTDKGVPVFIAYITKGDKAIKALVCNAETKEISQQYKKEWGTLPESFVG